MNSNEALIFSFSIEKAQRESHSALKEEFLTGPEIERLRKVSDEGRRREFLASRYACKVILESFSGVEKNKIDLEEVVKREQVLVCKVEGRTLYASLSHHDHLIAFAVTTIGPVGIDLEQRDRDVKVLKDASDEDRRNFFRTWTEREAKIKAGAPNAKFPYEFVQFHDEKFNSILCLVILCENSVQREKITVSLHEK